jgi:cytochrome c-type biogenesis protein CcmF
MPWLTGTALVHSAIVVEKRESLKIWTVLLAIGTFSLSLSGTFLVRSGILNSVHAFANDPARGIFILSLLGLVIGGSLLLFALRAPLLKSGGIFAPVSREGALVLNNILLCSICAVVIAGTMTPPFADLLLGQKISVGAPYFNLTVLPLAIPVFVAMAVGPLLPWKRGRLWPLVEHAWWAALIAALVGGVCAFGMKLLPALAFGAAAWLIIGSFAEVFERTLLFRAPVANSVRRARGLPVAVLGAAIAHAGMGVTVAGIAATSLDSNKIVEAKVGDSFSVGGYQWILLGLDDAPGPNYRARVATIEVLRDGRPLAMMKPERRMFTSQNQTTSDVAIRTNLFRDLYAVLGDERDGKAVLRLHVNPLAPWIWLGALIMAAGGALSLADRRLRVGAPSRAPKAAVPA